MQTRAQIGGGLLAMVVVATLAAAGCSGWGVRTDMAMGTQLAQARTFAWTESSQPDFYRSLAGQRVRALVDQGLVARGFRPARAGETADLLVSTRYQADDDLAVFWSGGWTGGYGYWGAGGWDTVYPFTRGTLTVDLIDARTRNVVWHAVARKDKLNPELDRNDVWNAVNKIVAQMPPRWG